MSRPRWVEPPADLGAKAVEYWRYYAPGFRRVGALTPENRETFRTLCVLLAARDAASAAIAAHGVVIMAPTGAIKANPAVGALLKLERRVADLLNDFENVVVQHGNKRISAF